MSTTLIRSQKCSWCDCKMRRGEKCWILKSGKFDAHIKKILSVICGNRNLHCPGTKMLITSFLLNINKPWLQEFNTPYCTDCGIFDLKFTRSGRTIVAPMRLSDEKFVKGSGISGCDHYDGGYNNGIGAGETPINNHANLRDFVVDDTIVEYDQTLQPDEEFRDCEEEWNDSETSDEEDEWSCDSDEE